MDKDFTQITDQDLQTAESFRQREKVAVLVIMFTDIQESTQLLERMGEREYAKFRRLHDELIRSTVEDGDGGCCVKHLGDGFMSLFTEPSTAVERCLQIQECLTQFGPLRIRIGLDMGQIAVERTGGIARDAFGRFVNRASRIMSAASGGQILASYHVWDSAIGWLSASEVGWRNLGELQVKGFVHPVRVYEFYSLRDSARVRTEEPLHCGNLIFKPAPAKSLQPAALGRSPDPASTAGSIPGSAAPPPAKSHPRLKAVAAMGIFVALGIGIMQIVPPRKALRPEQSQVSPPGSPMQPPQPAPSQTATVSAPPGREPAPPDRGNSTRSTSEQLSTAGESDRSRVRRISTLIGGSGLALLVALLALIARRARQSPRLLWLDSNPKKTSFARSHLAETGREVHPVSSLAWGIAKLLVNKYDILVVAAATEEEGRGRVRRLQRLSWFTGGLQVVLFGNLQTVQKIAVWARLVPKIQCTASVGELTALVKVECTQK